MPAVNGTELPSNITNAEPGAKPAKPAKPAKKAGKSVENVYQKKTQLEHILLRPDTYIGSIEYVTEPMWVYDAEEDKILQKEIAYVPGLYKIFDEILVNAADNKQRDPDMDTIKIDIDTTNNQITIFNNGRGIPVAMHKEQKMYVPTMIFGHLLTSSNYNDEEQKVTGGRNGYGAKLCNIFSTKFSVETASEEYSKIFKQTWGVNMSKASEPKIRDFEGPDFTRVSFTPDLEKFKMQSLDENLVGLLSRRAYDIAASSKGVKVYLNGKKIPVKNFKEYVDLYLKDKVDDADNPVKAVYENANARWEVAIAISDKGFQQMSFVNSIATTKGGRHVDHVTDLVVKSITESLKRKNKGGMQIKPFQIKNHMWVFVNCLIVNPTFDSQTKENMTLQLKSFGSKCTLSDKFTNAVMKGGIVESVMAWAKFKQQAQLNSKCQSKKQNKLKGIPKLEDANDAGTRNSQGCTLILTEGDSAKTLAVAGLGVVGRDRYGVFPLKGKLLNVREASHKQILENAEINNIIKILGLQYKKAYNTSDDMKTLRYGKLMIMTDQDQDGSHIKGLLINFIHHNWPTLLHRPFMEEFITPIVKATKGKEEISFYSLPEFEEWKKAKDNWPKYKIKYYKGLGTSTSKEAKEYFSDMLRHRIIFNYNGNEDDHSIQMAFSKKAIDQRKEWLTGWMEECKRRKELGLPDVYLYEKNTRAITYADFVNKELVLFSNLDNERSIPCLVDGFKPGQRKVMYTCLKRNDKREVKVAQLAGSIAEHSAYHHGEASLMGTIINLAQNYVGSNNINLLQPIGQFGTRLQGGKDSASPRYIFTMLSKLAKHIFHPDDKALLKSNFDDNQRIEPEWYIPIIPMILVNGADGIGTGWSTKISNYNPREIISNLKKMIKGGEPTIMKPWFKNFRGTIEELDHQRYLVNGELSDLGNSKIEITELPVRVWTQAYKESVMETFMTGTEKTAPIIHDYKEYHTDTTVRFVVSMTDEKYKKTTTEGFHKTFKLQSSLSTGCMVLFDANGVLRKYETVEEILKEFFELRLKFYVKRKTYLVGMLEAETCKLSNQARFILEKCDGRLVIENKKRKDMIAELQRKGYDADPVKAWLKLQDRDAAIEEDQDQEQQESDGEEKEDTKTEKGTGYDYLLGMTMWSMTKERKDELLKKRDDKTQELELLKEKTPEGLWENDLDVLLNELNVVEKAEIDSDISSHKAAVKKEKGAGKKGSVSADTRPSKYGDRIVPFIDAELRKKAEKAAAAKEKGKRTIKKETVAPEVDDFDDLVAANTGKSLASRLGNSPDAIIKKARAKKGEGAKAKAAAAATSAASASASSGDGMKQTKIPFKKVSPKKRKGKAEWETDSEDQDDTLDSDIEESPRKEPTRTTSRRTAASKVKFSFGDEEAMISDDDEDVLMDNDGIEEPDMPISQSLLEETTEDLSQDVVISDTDSEFEAKPPPKPKAAPKSKAAPKPAVAPKPAAAPKPAQPSPPAPAPEKPSASDLFDSMISGLSPGPEPASPEPVAMSQAQKRVKSFDSSDEDDEPQPKKPAPKAKAAAIVSLVSDDDELPPILKKKTASKAGSKPVPKKKTTKKIQSDSDSDYGVKKPRKKAVRAKAPAKKKNIIGSDSDNKMAHSDSDSDSDFDF